MAAAAVGKSRTKFKVSPPTMDGPDEFVRTLRAQQNGLEFALLFQVLLWISGIFFHQVPAALLGLVYVYGRREYFNGYIQKAELRRPGFALTVKTIKVFLALCVAGIANTLLKQYLGINVVAMAMKKYYGTK